MHIYVFFGLNHREARGRVSAAVIAAFPLALAQLLLTEQLRALPRQPRCFVHLRDLRLVFVDLLLSQIVTERNRHEVDSLTILATHPMPFVGSMLPSSHILCLR